MNTPFARKVAYGAAIAALLYPLFLLGQPASRGRESRGGKLAQMRDQYNLSQVSLGEIDPASESLRLASLGMRGVAANHLWLKAQEFKKKENWEALSATLNQITKLQPNFMEVWEFQSHNLAYNVSAEFDDYRYRYRWVKKGVDFLVKGVHYNRDEPQLLHVLGKTTGQKMGTADEKVLFRELYRDDTDWHSELASDIPEITGPEVKGPTGKPDNWLTARLWYLKAERAVDSGNKVLRGNSPLIFHQDRPKQRINFAQAIQDEGYFDQATEAWRDGGKEWTDDYGSRTIPSSWGVAFQLREKEEVLREAVALRDELDALLPGLRESMEAEKLALLTEIEQRAYKSTEEDRESWTEDTPEAAVYWTALSKMRFDDTQIAARAPENVRAKARRLAARIDDQLMLAERISRYRSMVNFDYWAMRADAEQTQLVADARTKLYTAAEKLQEADLDGAQADYEKAWDLWDEIFVKWPALRSSDSMADLKPELVRYRRVLDHQNKSDIPPDFKLAWLLDGEELAAIEANFDKQQAEDAARGKIDSPNVGSEDASPNTSPDAPTPSKDSADRPTEKPAPQAPAAKTPDQSADDDSSGTGPLPPLEAPAAKDNQDAKEQASPPLEEELNSSLRMRAEPIASRIAFSWLGAMVGMVQADNVDQLPPLEVEPLKQPKKPSSATKEAEADTKAKAAADEKAADKEADDAKAKAAADKKAADDAKAKAAADKKTADKEADDAKAKAAADKKAADKKAADKKAADDAKAKAAADKKAADKKAADKKSADDAKAKAAADKKADGAGKKPAKKANRQKKAPKKPESAPKPSEPKDNSQEDAPRQPPKPDSPPKGGTGKGSGGAESGAPGAASPSDLSPEQLKKLEESRKSDGADTKPKQSETSPQPETTPPAAPDSSPPPATRPAIAVHPCLPVVYPCVQPAQVCPPVVQCCPPERKRCRLFRRRR